MEFSVLYELEMAKPWGPGQEYQTLMEAMAQIRLADQVGFDMVWSVEHHFLEEYSHSSAPEVWLAAVAAQTKNIRIGHGVKLLPFQYNHPLRVAESVAMLDLVSGGRVEFGTGRSVTEIELGGFGIDPDQTRDMWSESLDIVVKAWTEETMEHNGKLLQIPPRKVIPKPIQKPHPPIWLAGTAPESFEIAGENGLGALTFAFTEEAIVDNLAIYRKSIAKCTNPKGKFINNKYAAFCLPLVGSDPETQTIGVEGAQWFLQKVTEILLTMDKIESDSYAYLKKTIDLHNLPKDTPLSVLNEHPLIICGGVDYCIRKIEKLADLGIDQLICFMQRGRIPHSRIMDTIDNFGKYILPHFRERNPSQPVVAVAG